MTNQSFSSQIVCSMSLLPSDYTQIMRSVVKLKPKRVNLTLKKWYKKQICKQWKQWVVTKKYGNTCWISTHQMCPPWDVSEWIKVPQLLAASGMIRGTFWPGDLGGDTYSVIPAGLAWPKTAARGGVKKNPYLVKSKKVQALPFYNRNLERCSLLKEWVNGETSYD